MLTLRVLWNQHEGRAPPYGETLARVWTQGQWLPEADPLQVLRRTVFPLQFMQRAVLPELCNSFYSRLRGRHYDFRQNAVNAYGRKTSLAQKATSYSLMSGVNRCRTPLDVC